MIKRKLFKQTAAVVLSAAVISSGLPVTAFAADESAEVVVEAIDVTAVAEDVTAGESAEETNGSEETISDNEVGENAEADGVFAEETVSDFEDTDSEDTISSDDNTEEDVDFADDSSDFVDEASETAVEYVLMNIPYAEFYRSEVNNSVDVDAFTSATKSKTLTQNLAAGSYHVSTDGSDITGVIFPVKVAEGVDLSDYTQVTDSDHFDITVTNRGETVTTTYVGKETLFENQSYSYYVLSEAPAYYKELTIENGVLSFGKTVGEVTSAEASARLLTDTSYGDYQLNIDTDVISNDDSVNAVVISTKEGASYGLRHVENIWLKTQLAWSTGFTTEVHKCPTSSEHYKAMMGQTIDKVTYYTSSGIYELTLDEEIYVPVKFTGSVTVEDADLSDGKTAVEVTGLPEDFVPEYSVSGLTDAKVEGNTLTYSTSAQPGTYTLEVKDQSGKYASIKGSFVLSTSVVPAVYDQDAKALKAAEGFSEEQFTAYLGKITSVSVNDKEYTSSGKGAVTIVNKDGSINTEADPIKESGDYDLVVKAAGYPDLEFMYTGEESVKYVYAGLSWAEYWASESVYAAGDASSSSELDSRDEADTGAYDAVSRATVNHGLHRGSYQCTAILYGEDGSSFQISYWTSSSTAVLTDGTTLGFNRGTITKPDGSTVDMDHYVVTGIKYVPVAVNAEDYEDFCKAYSVVENDGTLAGGFSENNLSSYTATAEVNATTNGLKTAVKNSDGTFSFQSRVQGTTSGLKDTELKTASGLTATVKNADGTYGEFLRVDITGDYGALGAAMQAVRWDYYGNGDTVLRSFGTKFAADNWMHKAMGIQLGLTNSLRCQLPEGTDGTGKWVLTIYALGYADTTITIQATSDNIVKPSEEKIDTTALEAIIAQAEALKETDYTAESWQSMQMELEEAKDELKALHSQAAVDEAISHLTQAIEGLVKAVKVSLDKTSATIYVGGTPATVTLKATVTGSTETVTYTSSNTSIATVNSKGVVTAKKAGTATITATCGTAKATCKVTVKAPSVALSKTAATLYVGGSPATLTLKATLTGINKTVTYTSSNTAIATVNSKGVVTAKKAGTATITATCGTAKATCKVTVRQPSIKLNRTSATIYTKGTTRTTLSVTKTGINKTVSFKSSNTKIATVSSSGVVTAKKAGTVTITATCGTAKATCKVTVKAPTLTLSKTSASIAKGKTVTIQAKATPSGTITYRSSNTKIATVSSKGVVKGIKKGTATITVTCNGVSKTFKVTVK